MKPEKTEDQILLNKPEEARQTAVAEAGLLNDRYGTCSNYSFEHGGRQMSAAFAQARLETSHDSPNACQIELVTPHGTIVEGDCLITGSHGRRVEGDAIMVHGLFET